MGEKDENTSSIGIMVDGEFFKGENKYPTIDCSNITCGEIDCSNIVIRNPISMNVDFVPPNELTLSDVFTVLCGIESLEQLKCNNWRKLHGFPMKRRR